MNLLSLMCTLSSNHRIVAKVPRHGPNPPWPSLGHLPQVYPGRTQQLEVVPPLLNPQHSTQDPSGLASVACSCPSLLATKFLLHIPHFVKATLCHAWAPGTRPHTCLSGKPGFTPFENSAQTPSEGAPPETSLGALLRHIPPRLCWTRHHFTFVHVSPIVISGEPPSEQTVPAALPSDGKGSPRLPRPALNSIRFSVCQSDESPRAPYRSFPFHCPGR